ncbi:MAG: VCBS repeat-containing protein [Gemmatimonadetes bacterium]|nr:VCBS repeat-containing protein [Gemmatimonadota bacterium]MDA1102654.1 VCBS repeat-containing protein [Gemmatimonadota bacterium]
MYSKQAWRPWAEPWIWASDDGGGIRLTFDHFLEIVMNGIHGTRFFRSSATWTLSLGLALGACSTERAPEPVRFAAFQPALFSDGGALTDAWADFDGDGDPDRFVGFNGTPSRLYRNDRVDGFVDVAQEVSLVVERAVRTSAWGDFDDDGDPDLLLGFAGDTPVTALYRNDGGARFTDVALDVGLQLSVGATRQASWIDYDEDGDLDLFLAMRDRANYLFENRGPVGFVDVAADVGLADERRTVGAVWFDWDQGGLDLVVANMNGDANELYLQADGRFTPAADLSVLHQGGRAMGDDAQGSVRPCVVDFDSDGDFDVFFANYGPNGLLERTAPHVLVNIAEAVGVANDSRYDTCTWGDFDHDGNVDLFVNGTVGGGVHYRDWLMRREGGAVFVDVTPEELLQLNASHGATWVDFDLDGDLDLALAGSADDGMHHLMQNLLRPEYSWHSLQVRVLDAEGHATRPGAEARLYAAGSETLLGTRLVDTGSAYDAQSDLPVHFGVRGGQTVDVHITILAGGERRVAVLQGIKPSDYQGRFLEVRLDDSGRPLR